MPLYDLFARLTSGERAALPFIQAGILRKLSANKILSALSAGGLGIRRTNGLALIRALSGVLPARDYIASVNLDKRIDPVRLSPALGPTLRNYTYTVKVEGTNRLTGEGTLRFVNVVTDDLITKGYAVRQALDIIASNPEAYELDPLRASVTFVLVDPVFYEGLVAA